MKIQTKEELFKKLEKNKKYLVKVTSDGIYVRRFKEPSLRGRWGKCANCHKRVKLIKFHKFGKTLLKCPECHKMAEQPKAKII